VYKIFYSPGACSLASHIALAEAGAPYEAVRVNFAAGEQRSPQYLSVNPKGRVPALVTDKGILTETPAILVWIAQTFPNAKLFPAGDPWTFAQAQSFNSYLCSTVHVHHAHRTRGSRWADDEASQEGMKKKVAQNMTDAFTLIEREMLKGPWVLGADYSMCDPYLFTLSAWLEGDGVDIANFPKVADHYKRMLQRPAVQRALTEQGLPIK
jgi:glutathione S-transferase